MRKIKIYHWTEIRSDGKEAKTDTRNLISIMVGGINQQDVPRGLENFKIVGELQRSLDNSKDKDVLILEESVYNFLEKHCFPQIPAVWAMIPGVSDTIIALTEAEKINPNE